MTTLICNNHGYIALSIFIAIVALMVMILVHESGHYLVGKLLKFKINEFSIGFGPKLFSRRSKKTGELFAIRAIPLGGFCAFEGEDQDSKVEGAFNSQKPWKRILVLLAGVTFNFLSAVIILTILFATYGYTLPSVDTLDESPEGFEQNFQVGDIIYEVNGSKVYSLLNTNLNTLLSAAGDSAEVVVIREGKKTTITVYRAEFDTEETAEDGTKTVKKTKRYGVSMIRYVDYRLGFGEALGRSFVFIWQLVILTFKTIGGLFTGAVGLKGSVGGTVTSVAAMGSITMHLGFRGVLLMFGIMSASVALMNILPFPALDGSRIIFVLIEAIFRKPVNRNVEAIIHTVGIVILFAFAILCDILNIGTISKLF